MSELFTERLRRLRKAAGMKQESLAYDAGCTHDVISHFERGNNARVIGNLTRIAGALNVSLDYLMTGAHAE